MYTPPFCPLAVSTMLYQDHARVRWMEEPWPRQDSLSIWCSRTATEIFAVQSHYSTRDDYHCARVDLSTGMFLFRPFFLKHPDCVLVSLLTNLIFLTIIINRSETQLGLELDTWFLVQSACSSFRLSLSSRRKVLKYSDCQMMNVILTGEDQ
jgi:hypothetical protein